MKYLVICGYNLILIAGTAYLCVMWDWSLWCFLITACFVLTLREKDE